MQPWSSAAPGAALNTSTIPASAAIERSRPGSISGCARNSAGSGTCQTSIRWASPAGASTSVSAAPTSTKKSRRMFLAS
ncbi:hypothetical protein BE04_15880 [Sorangium cellulosum]|uniref:Uncharacterized protein n=1 Tax=Sorangium cellulosum TaxID=56 RepID=A0A150PH82_SORCE|nr:hypothetical protein BE04_15880 [Sorangium cellulosum]